jgi:hypothetical protein
VQDASHQVPLLLAIELALALRSARAPHVAEGDRRNRGIIGKEGGKERKSRGKGRLATANNKRGILTARRHERSK